ncbi:MAG: InlB B-repeat-containing protein [Lachnospiraceae bacterium]|nr:InlB B-repeat-containing protein [Lachnospiraceae bacterium]
MSRSGYWFLGWSTSSTATTGTYKTGSEISVSKDTVLYAVWKKK